MWSKEKAVRDEREFEVLGASKGRGEIVSANPLRVLALMGVTWLLVLEGVTDLELFQIILGC